jgi:hypothetical protein
MDRKFKRLSIAVLALGAGLAVAIPLAGSGTAGAGEVPTVKTSLVAHSIVVDLNDVNIQARVPLRPSAHLYAKVGTTKVPLAGQFVQFFASGHDLCAVKTDANGYAECAGIVRLTWSTLALGKYLAVHPETSVDGTTYLKSSDTGQLITIGSTSIFAFAGRARRAVPVSSGACSTSSPTASRTPCPESAHAAS